MVLQFSHCSCHSDENTEPLETQTQAMGRSLSRPVSLWQQARKHMPALTAIHVPPNMPAHLELGQAVPICQTRLKEAMKKLWDKKLRCSLFVIMHSLDIPTESWFDNHKCIRQQVKEQGFLLWVWELNLSLRTGFFPCAEQKRSLG